MGGGASNRGTGGAGGAVAQVAAPHVRVQRHPLVEREAGVEVRQQARDAVLERRPDLLERDLLGKHRGDGAR